MQCNMTFATMCQGSRLLGMSSSDEKVLESMFRKLVAHNGMDYAIAQLKTLKQHTIQQIQDPSYRLPKDYFKGKQPLKWNWSADRPKGPLSVIYKTWTKPSSRIRGIGALINSFTEEQPSKSQLKKLLDGVNSHGEYADDRILPISTNDAVRYVQGVNRQLKDQKPLDGTDLTGSLMPYGNFTENISFARRDLLSTDNDRRHSAVSVLSHALDGQWKDAPRIVTDYIRKEIPCYKDIHVNDKDTGVVARDYEYNPKVKTYGRHIDDQYAGTVSFLQKPGGKLRSVFNTDRVVNYAMRPYAKGLENAFYKAYPKHIFVERQDKGMESIQQMLKRHHTLVSADLTSATDLLNFRTFTNGLRYKTLTLMYGKQHKDKIRKLSTYRGTERVLKHFEEPKAKQLLSRKVGPHKMFTVKQVTNALKAVNLFERVAEMPFYSKDLQSAVALRTGQPLGLYGSFQTLTSMNFVIGRAAEVKSNYHFSKEIPQFAVVGDDFVGDVSIMDKYSEIIASCNGKDNHEKALKSSKYAEFLSHLMTKDKIIDMKPKFRLGHNSLWVNAEKTTTSHIDHVYRLNQDDKEALMTLAAIGDPHGSSQRAIGTPNRLKREQRQLIQSALKRISLQESEGKSDIGLSPETIQLSRDEQSVDRNYIGSELNFSRKDAFGKYRVVRPVRTQDIEHYSPETTRFDHHQNKYASVDDMKLSNVASQAKKKAKLASQLIDTLDNNVDHKVKLPFHKRTTVSTSQILSDAVDAVRNSDNLSDNVIFPSSRDYNYDKNEVDRSHSYEENFSVESVKKPNMDPLVLQLADYLLQSRRVYHSLDKNQDTICEMSHDPERQRLHRLYESGKCMTVQTSKETGDAADMVNKYSKSENTEAEQVWRENYYVSLQNSLPKSASSVIVQDFSVESHISVSNLMSQLDDIGQKSTSSPTMTNTDDLEEPPL